MPLLQEAVKETILELEALTVTEASPIPEDTRGKEIASDASLTNGDSKDPVAGRSLCDGFFAVRIDIRNFY
jgi:hypothetical protein